MDRFHLMICTAAVTCLTILATTATSQGQSISEQQTNGYFAPVTIEEHPDCNGPGDTAFSLEIDAEDLRFRLKAKEWENSFDLGGDKWFGTDAADICYVTQGHGADRIRSEVPCSAQSAALPSMCEIEERRGTELVRIKIACGDKVENAARAAILGNQTMRLDLSVDVTACQSVMKFNIIDAYWAAEVTVGDTITRHEGDFERPFGNIRYRFSWAEQPLAEIAYAISNTIGNAPRSGQNGDSPSFFWVALGGIPVDLPQAAGQPVFLTTNAIVFPTVDGMAACTTGDCDFPRYVNMFDD